MTLSPLGASRPRQQAPRKKVVVPLTFHSTSPPKRALLCVLTASFLVAAPPGSKRRACGGASIATGAVQRWRTRSWPLDKPASKRRPRQRLRSKPGSSKSRSATANPIRNVAVHGHEHALQRPGSIKQEQRQRQQWLTVP